MANMTSFLRSLDHIPWNESSESKKNDLLDRAQSFFEACDSSSIGSSENEEDADENLNIIHSPETESDEDHDSGSNTDSEDWNGDNAYELIEGNVVEPSIYQELGPPTGINTTHAPAHLQSDANEMTYMSLLARDLNEAQVKQVPKKELQFTVVLALHRNPTYLLKANSEQDCSQWVVSLHMAVKGIKLGDTRIYETIEYPGPMTPASRVSSEMVESSEPSEVDLEIVPEKPKIPVKRRKKRGIKNELTTDHQAETRSKSSYSTPRELGVPLRKETLVVAEYNTIGPGQLTPRNGHETIFIPVPPPIMALPKSVQVVPPPSPLTSVAPSVQKIASNASPNQVSTQRSPRKGSLVTTPEELMIPNFSKELQATILSRRILEKESEISTISTVKPILDRGESELEKAIRLRRERTLVPGSSESPRQKPP
eukprot:maker-scaffold642_size120736-snap-gene-0.28 protein:Tk12599 transcript:maker-scaffold642_size120736-snap-gene-0.28-mRNA-1 annotation:"pleckstrin homology domain-containing family a member 2"